MSARMGVGLIVVLLVIAVLLDVTGIAPGAGMQAVPFLVLLGAGLLIWRAVWPGGEAVRASEVDVPLDGIRTARLNLTFGAGDLAISASAPPDHLLGGHLAGAARRAIEQTADHAAVRFWQPLSLVGRRRAGWEIGLSPAVTWEQIKLSVGASELRLALADLPVGELLVETGGTQVTAALPRAREATVHISGGKVSLAVPDGIAVDIRNEIRLGEVIIDEQRFRPVGEDHWATPDAAASEQVLCLVLKGGLGTVKVAGAEA